MKQDMLPPGFFGRSDASVYGWLIKQVPIEGHMVELGTWLGRSLCSVAHHILDRNINVIGVDTFEGTLNEMGEGDCFEEAIQGTARELFEINLVKAGINKNVEIIQNTTLEAAKLFEDVSFDLVFIDADHSYEAVKADILAWLPKVKIGGIIGGHDYTYKEPGVMKAVREIFGVPKRRGASLNWWYSI